MRGLTDSDTSSHAPPPPAAGNSAQAPSPANTMSELSQCQHCHHVSTVTSTISAPQAPLAPICPTNTWPLHQQSKMAGSIILAFVKPSRVDVATRVHILTIIDSKDVLSYMINCYIKSLFSPVGRFFFWNPRQRAIGVVASTPILA